MLEQGFVNPGGEPGQMAFARAVAKQFGGKPDTHRQTIIKILKGITKNPHSDTSKKYAKVLKQPADFLLSENAQRALRGSGLARTIQHMVGAQEAGEDPSVYAAELAAELEGLRRLLEAAEAALARLAKAKKRGSR